MKFKFLLSAFAVFIFLNATAQTKTIKAYAITSEKQGTAVWTEVKLIDLQSGEVLKNIFESGKDNYQVLSARTGLPIRIKDEKGLVTDLQKIPFAGPAAACAYDKKHNRLYYTPMFINQLRYIDLDANEPKIYYFDNETLSAVKDINSEANHITRMVIGADGNGYALNNDATHLIQFTTGRKPVITDLGSVGDDAANGQVSIRNRCTSWGGDLIADAMGNLYLVSANRSVFRIDVERRVASYIASIEGLPGNFTTNGAVVDSEGKLVVSSANSIAGYYKVDMKQWKATLIPSSGKVFNTSDLANGYLAFEKEKPALPRLMTRSMVANNKIAVYPNPVRDGMFRVSFNSRETGVYAIQLVDITGRIAVQQQANIGLRGQVAEVEVEPHIAKGVYMVKVLNNNKKTIFSGKIYVE